MIQLCFLNKRHSKRQKYKWKIIFKKSHFTYCTNLWWKRRRWQQFYEPVIHHILQKKKLVDSLKNNVTIQWAPRVPGSLKEREGHRKERDCCKGGKALFSAKDTQGILVWMNGCNTWMDLLNGWTGCLNASPWVNQKNVNSWVTHVDTGDKKHQALGWDFSPPKIPFDFTQKY